MVGTWQYFTHGLHHPLKSLGSRSGRFVVVLLLCALSALALANEALERNEQLLELAYSGDSHEVRRVLRAGADVNYANAYGETPLMFAAMNNHADVVRVLLLAGAELEARDAAGWTPLMFAIAESPYVSVVEALLAAGADVHADANDQGVSPLSLARQRSLFSFVMDIPNVRNAQSSEASASIISPASESSAELATDPAPAEDVVIEDVVAEAAPDAAAESAIADADPVADAVARARAAAEARLAARNREPELATSPDVADEDVSDSTTPIADSAEDSDALPAAAQQDSLEPTPAPRWGQSTPAESVSDVAADTVAESAPETVAETIVETVVETAAETVTETAASAETVTVAEPASASSPARARRQISADLTLRSTERNVGEASSATASSTAPSPQQPAASAAASHRLAAVAIVQGGNAANTPSASQASRPSSSLTSPAPSAQTTNPSQAQPRISNLPSSGAASEPASASMVASTATAERDSIAEAARSPQIITSSAASPESSRAVSLRGSDSGIPQEVLAVLATPIPGRAPMAAPSASAATQQPSATAARASLPTITPLPPATPPPSAQRLALEPHNNPEHSVIPEARAAHVRSLPRLEQHNSNPSSSASLSSTPSEEAFSFGAAMGTSNGRIMTLAERAAVGSSQNGQRSDAIIGTFRRDGEVVTEMSYSAALQASQAPRNQSSSQSSIVELTPSTTRASSLADLCDLHSIRVNEPLAIREMRVVDISGQGKQLVGCLSNRSNSDMDIRDVRLRLEGDDGQSFSLRLGMAQDVLAPGERVVFQSRESLPAGLNSVRVTQVSRDGQAVYGASALEAIGMLLVAGF